MPTCAAERDAIHISAFLAFKFVAATVSNDDDSLDCPFEIKNTTVFPPLYPRVLFSSCRRTASKAGTNLRGAVVEVAASILEMSTCGSNEEAKSNNNVDCDAIEMAAILSRIYVRKLNGEDFHQTGLLSHPEVVFE